MNDLAFIHIPKNAGSSMKQLSKQHNQIKYYYHNTDPNSISNDKLIILRNPISRFASAINFALTVYVNDSNVKKILSNDINTPDLFASAFFNIDNPCHNIVRNETDNTGRHKVGNEVLKYKWTYAHQSTWVQGYTPKSVILYENFESELQMLLSKLQIKLDKIPITNVTNSKRFNFSDRNLKSIQEFYSKDFDLYNFYKDMNVEKRLGIV